MCSNGDIEQVIEYFLCLSHNIHTTLKRFCQQICLRYTALELLLVFLTGDELIPVGDLVGNRIDSKFL